MLSISAMANGQERYYADLAREDYYLNGGEPLGRWFGKGAQGLGVASHVERDELSALFRGFGPKNQKLVMNAGTPNRQPGWDLTFSAPKSVSTLWSQASPPMRAAIELAHSEAFTAALIYVERTASVTRRGHGGTDIERVGLVVATFEHGTSRAQDPQLHTHCLVINAAMREDSSWGAIRSHDLYEHKMTAGALYRAELAYLLTHEQGLALKPEKSWFELEGVPRGLMEEFSKRRREVEQVLSAQNLSSSKAAGIAAASTSKTKQHVARSDLFPSWQETARAYRFSERAAERLFHAARPLSGRTAPLAIDTLAELTSSRSFFFERDVIRHMAEAAQDGSLRASEIVFGAWAAIGTSDILRFTDKEKPGQYFITTRELYETEREVLKMAEDSRTDARHVARADTVRAVLERPRFSNLSEEQQQAVEHLTLKDGSMQCLSGMAGTGKTHTLAAAREIWEAEGYKVVGCALAATAAKELERGSGIKSSTIRSTLRRLDNTFSAQIKHNLSVEGLRGQITPDALMRPKKRVVHNKPIFDKSGDIIRRGMKLDEKTVLVVDEAAMVGTRDFARLMRHAKDAGAKCVYAGDDTQLPSIDAGAPFRSLVAQLDAARLTDIQRQQKPWMRDAVKLFAEGDARGALSLYASADRLHIADTGEKASRELISDWTTRRLGDLSDTLILAGTRKETKNLNELAQAARRQRGELGFRFTKIAGQKLFEGDRVLFTENRRSLGVANGDFGTIEHVAVGVVPGSTALTVRLDRTERRGLFEKPIRTAFKVSEYDKLSLGYAVTTHKAQGATVEQAFVLAETIMQDRELSYVQMSRARNDAHIYISKADAGEDNCELVRQMNRSRPQQLAHEREAAESDRKLQRSRS